MLEQILKENKIIIIGNPLSGKRVLCDRLEKKEKELEQEGHFIIHTDDYMNFGYKESLYRIIDALHGKNRWIVEGIMGYRLLRKGAERNDLTLRPDLIIVCQSEEKPQKRHEPQIKGLKTVWEKYCHLEDKMPQMIKVQKQISFRKMRVL